MTSITSCTSQEATSLTPFSGVKFYSFSQSRDEHDSISLGPHAFPLSCVTGESKMSETAQLWAQGICKGEKQQVCYMSTHSLPIIDVSLGQKGEKGCLKGR